MAQRGRPSKAKPSKEIKAESYRHPEAESLSRPEAGTQAQFKKKKAPARYRYDSSLSPELAWDGQRSVRELGEWLLACIQDAAKLPPPQTFDSAREFKLNDDTVLATVRGLADAVEQLAALSKPFLNWTGKAERLSFDVPTLPLFVHERLSTASIIETLKSHKTDPYTQGDLFADPGRSIADQVLRSYEYKDKWVNRMILGDSLVVMNSLLEYEGMGGQVQMIYMDPPYGVKFGSNFQPFVRKRDVSHNDDDDMTREPEMVKAYRDTWELGLHSYLTYMRDRLLLARELLKPSGSIFVQISDENLHHVRELMDEVFGAENFCAVIPFSKSTGTSTNLLSQEFDYLLWYARRKEIIKYKQLYSEKNVDSFASYKYLVNPITIDIRPLSREIREGKEEIPNGYKIAQLSFAVSQDPGKPEDRYYEFKGIMYDCGVFRHWKTKNPEGLDRLAKANRLIGLGSQLNYIRYLDDFNAIPISTLWADTGSAGYSNTDPKLYVVQTDTTVIKRCILMTTDPSDLVIDPTCGSGTTAYVAEQWGRRWITMDTSRVPLALARQRLLTATYDWYELKEEERGPAGGFEYKNQDESRNPKIIGPGIVKHIMLENIANDEPPKEEVLVDRPERRTDIVRISGPFVLEATIPTPIELGDEDRPAAEDHGSFIDRMLEVLRKSPILHLGGGKTVELKNIRMPAKTLSLSAEALTEKGPVAIVFGPENGAVSERTVFEAAKEANAKNYTHLYVIGFAIQPNARKLVEECEGVVGTPAVYIQATPDLMMGDLLKNMRSSQIFSVCGLPDVSIKKVPTDKAGEPLHYTVTLKGLDVFDPSSMETRSLSGSDVPAWFLDADYNDLCFHVSQAFFPRTSAWESLKKALKGSYDEAVWDHLSGTESALFEAGEHGKIAVKVIDDRGNELMVVKNLAEAKK